MKTLITVLIICSLLESTVLPVDLVLIILICRSYLKSDKNNLILAFAFGLLDAHLNLTPLGFKSIIYLILIQTTESLSKVRLAGNSLLMVPLIFILLSIDRMATSFFMHQSLELFPKIFIESLISLPIFYLVRLWEERFIVRKEIKLKI